MVTTDVIDFAALGEDFVRDPFPFYAALRERAPVHRVRIPEGAEVWFVLGYDECRRALTDPRLSSNWDNRPAWMPRPGGDVGEQMLYSDPPVHERLRRLVSGVFTARRIDQFGSRVQQAVSELIDALDHGTVDLVRSLAFPLPARIISELLGVPSIDLAYFSALSSNALTAPDPADRAAAREEMTTYLVQLIDDKRSALGEDLMSSLIRVTDQDGDRLTPRELLGTAWLLLVAGVETTVGLISGTVLALLTHPDQLAALRSDPALIGGATEEALRYCSPLATPMFRFTTEPLDIAGTPVAEREIVLLSLAAANRDPARFSDPDQFQITRPAQAHLGFGHGIHFCLGAPLGRLNARTAVGELIRRCPALALDIDPADVTWRPGTLMRAPLRLPIRLDQVSE